MFELTVVAGAKNRDKAEEEDSNDEDGSKGEERAPLVRDEDEAGEKRRDDSTGGHNTLLTRTSSRLSVVVGVILLSTTVIALLGFPAVGRKHGTMRPSHPKIMTSTETADAETQKDAEDWGNVVVLPEPVFNSSCTPTALASYPGSGSTLTRLLLESTTGVWTGSVYGDVSLYNAQPHPFRGEKTTQDVVVVKTHGPWREQNTFEAAERAILVLRHPFHAIPSFYNWLYGYQQHKGIAHQVQAPQDAWETWRGPNVPLEISAWCRHVSYWMDRFRSNPAQLFIATFEELVHADHGPQVLSEMVHFLGFAPDAVGPIWHQVLRLNNSFDFLHTVVFSPAMTSISCLKESGSEFGPVARVRSPG